MILNSHLPKKWPSMKQLIFFLIALLLVGCQISKATFPTIQPSTQTPTLTPEPKKTETSLPTLTLTLQPIGSTSTAEPETSGAEPSQVDLAVPPPQTFQDCTLWPMLVGCSKDAVELTGHIAFYNERQQQLVGIDLTSGTAWQVPLKAPWWIAWSPNGQKLLAPMQAQSTDPDAVNNLTFDNQGHVVSQSIDSCIHFWEAEGATPKKCKEIHIVKSSSGAEAWTEIESQTGESRLLVRPNPGANAKVIKMTIPPSASYFYRLYSWLLDSPYLILYQWKDTTSHLRGMPLYIVDSRTGQAEEIGVASQLAPWNTVIAGDRLITVDMGASPNSKFGKDVPKLVLYNWRSRERNYPLPGTMLIKHLAVWPPQNPEWIAFSVDTKNPHAPEAEKLMPGSGVYLLDLKTGQVKPVANSNGTYQRVRWANNGAMLLYGAFPDQPTRQDYGELRAYRLEDQAQWVVGYIPYESFFYADLFMARQFLTYSEK